MSVQEVHTPTLECATKKKKHLSAEVSYAMHEFGQVELAHKFKKCSILGNANVRLLFYSIIYV